MARIIAEAGVRLVADGRGLGVQIRMIIRKAMEDGTSGLKLSGNLTKGMADDAEKDSNRVRKTLSDLGSFAAKAGKGLASAVLSGSKLLLIGTAAIGALAGVTQLAVGVGALGAAAIQAAGVLGLLPAVLVAVKAVSATVALGMSGMSDAFKAISSGDAAAFQESLKGLAPEAQKFAKEVRALKPAFDQLKLDVQNRMFLGLGERLKTVGNLYLPVADRLFVTMAGSINNAGHNLADFLSQAETVGQVTNLVDNVRGAFNQLVPATVPLASAFLTITEVGSRFLGRMSGGIVDLANRFSDFIDRAAGNGQLEAFFENAIAALQTLGRIAANVFGTFSNVMQAASASGGSLLANIENITQKIQDFTGSTKGQSALTGFFETMRRVVEALGPAFFELITIVGRDFLPILADIAEIIGPILKPLFEALGRLLQALRPLIEAVAEAFGIMLEALGPVIDAFGQAITEAMPQLRPMLIDIGKAFAELIKAMAPLAPVFVDLLMALLPIIPPFIQMIADLMPRFIEIIQEMMPLIEALARTFIAIIPIFTDIVGFLLDVFIPVFGFIIDVIAGLVDFVTWAVTGIWSIITTVFGAIGDFFSAIWGAISSTFSGAVDKVSSVVSGGFTGIAKFVGERMRDFLGAVGDAIKGVVQFFIDLPGKILQALKDIGSWLIQAGKDLLWGLIEGIKDAVMAVVNAVVDALDATIKAAKQFLGISSPSKVFAEMGMNMGLGLVKGIEGVTPDVADAATAMAAAALGAADDLSNVSMTPSVTGAGAGAAGAAGAGMVVNQTNVMRPGTDVNQFSRLVLQRGWGDYLSGASTLTVRRNPVQAGVDDMAVSL
jgi:phage-related protein